MGFAGNGSNPGNAKTPLKGDIDYDSVYKKTAVTVVVQMH